VYIIWDLINGFYRILIKILIIDDDPEIRQLLKDYLAKENFRITAAGSVK